MVMFGTFFVFFHFLSSKPAWYVRFRGSVTCAQKADTMGIFFQCVTRSCPTLIFEAPSEHLKWQIQLGIRSFMGVRRAGRNSLKAINILPKVLLSILLKFYIPESPVTTNTCVTAKLLLVKKCASLGILGNPLNIQPSNSN